MASTPVDLVGERSGAKAPVLSYAEAARLAVATEVQDTDDLRPTALEVSAEGQALMRALPAALHDVDLPGCMAVTDGRGIPEDVHRYQLYPVIGPDSVSKSKTVNGFQTHIAPESYGTYVRPDGVDCDYSSSGAYVDTPSSAGLLYNGRLVALAGAVPDGATLRIEQIQGMIRPKGYATKDPLEGTGLDAGFRWRDTLVNVWQEVGAQLGFTAIEIQGHQNCKWYRDYDKKRTRRLVAGYDKVAVRLGFEATEAGNWRKSLVD